MYLIGLGGDHQFFYLGGIFHAQLGWGKVQALAIEQGEGQLVAGYGLLLIAAQQVDALAAVPEQAAEQAADRAAAQQGPVAHPALLASWRWVQRVALCSSR